MARTNIGLDMVSAAWLAFQTAYRGTATTAPTATTFTTDGVNIPANTVVGQFILVGTVAGIIQSNTSATNSVLTIDRWYDLSSLPATAGTAAATTPAAGAWHIPPGNAPASYMALANNATATAPAVTDTALTGEITTAGGGLIRALGTYAHTATSGGSATVTLTKTWTANGTDSLPVTVSQAAIFQGVASAASRLAIKTALNANATLSASGDQIQCTSTITAA